MPWTTIDVGPDQTVRRVSTTTVARRGTAPQKAVTSTSTGGSRRRGTAGNGGVQTTITTATQADRANANASATPTWARFQITPKSLRIATASTFATDAERDTAMACAPDVTPTHTIAEDWNLSASSMSAPPSPSGVPFSVRLVGTTTPEGGPQAPASEAATTAPRPAPTSVARSKPSDASDGPTPTPNRATDTVAPSDANGPPKASVGESAPADHDASKHEHLKEELKSVKTALMQQTEAAAAAMQVSQTTAAENTRLKAEINSLKQQLAAVNATPPVPERIIGASPTKTNRQWTTTNVDAELDALRSKRMSRTLVDKAKALAQNSALWDVTVSDTKQSGVTVFEISITDKAGGATKNVMKRFSQIVHLEALAEAKVPSRADAHKLFQKRAKGVPERREMLKVYFKTAFTAPDLASFWMAML